MSPQSLTNILNVGRKVDPIIFEAIGHETTSDFRGLLKYYFDAGGKRMRAALVILSCASAGGRIEDALRPAAVVEMIHNYSLVMDDLIDRGRVRRGRPTLRMVAGDSASLLVAMYYREVLDEILQASLLGSKIRQIAIRAMKEIIDGERFDLLFEQAGRNEPYLVSHRYTKPSFSRYLNMIGKKTAALFKAAAEIGGELAGVAGGTVQNLGEFGWNLGLGFQIMDDVLDICGRETGKERAKDVVEHKLGNAVILVALRYMTRGRAELLAILKSKKVSSAMARRAQALIATTPAETECRGIATTYLETAKQHLRVLKQSEYKRALELLSDLVVSRQF